VYREIVMSTTGRKPGRPFDSSRDVAILEATASLLGEVGWDRFTMLAVAERARVSLATIYRRWDTKTELALAATESLLVSAVDGSLTSISELLAQRGDLIPSLLALQRSEPGQATVIRDRLLTPLMIPLEAQVRHRAGRPLDADLVSLIALIGPALLLVRAVFLDDAMDENTVLQVQHLVGVLVDAVSASIA
jgi:AcrR family transcriptional regulator